MELSTTERARAEDQSRRPVSDQRSRGLRSGHWRPGRRHAVARDGAGPDFIEALARGLDVITAFGSARPVMTLAEVASATGLARPTARRILLTLAELGYVRAGERGFALTPRVLDLGVAYVDALGLWDVARPHLE